MDPFSLPALFLVFVMRTLLLQPFTISSGSMLPTVEKGDYVVSTKFSYGYDQFSLEGIGRYLPPFEILKGAPARGDVVIFALPSDPSVTYVKRVIGIAGDRVQMIGGITYLNGQPLPRRHVGEFTNRSGEYLRVPRYTETLPNGKSYDVIKLAGHADGDDTPEFTVPAGHCFVLGDNRDNSIDSRFSVGYVPYANVYAKLLIMVDYSGSKLMAHAIR